MKLLILGGSGFVSGTLARLALTQGHEVWSVTRGNRDAVEGVHSLTADRSSAEQLRSALTGANVRFDAALDCICFNDDQAHVDLDVLPSFTGRLVVISTDSVYDPYHKTVPQAEQSDWYMQDGGYGCKKRQMEEVFLAADTPLRWTIFRPGHIYGAGSELGCYPEQSRQSDLLAWMRADKPLRLVGGGEFLIHPIYAEDLARTMLSCIDKPDCDNEIFCIGGPEIITNAHYYELIGEIVGHPPVIENVPLEGYLEAHPQFSGHLCHRAYCLDKLAATGADMPSTPMLEGLRKHIQWLDKRDN